MRAATHTTYGAPQVLMANEVNRPTIKEHEVLIQVHASPVTQGDRRLRAADFPGISWLLGRLMFGLFRPKHPIPGTAFAGRVVAVGEGVTRFAVGDDVFGSSLHSAHAQYMAVAEDSTIAQLPDGFGYDEACALPYGGVTAVVFLQDLAEVQPGQRVLIVGAAGGVGQCAVQLAHHLGAEVTGVDSHDGELVCDLGADHFIDYRKEDFTMNGQRYDVILDTTPTAAFRRACGSLTPTGRYLSLTISISLLVQMAVTKLLGGPRAVAGVAMGQQRHLETLRRLAEEGAFRPVIARHFPLENVVDAHVFLESGHASGAVVIDIPQPPPKTRIGALTEKRRDLPLEIAPHLT